MQIAVRKEDEVRALLRARRLGIDIKLEWKQSVLDDSETPFWWREVDGEMEVVLTDHRRPTYLPAPSRAHVGARATYLPADTQCLELRSSEKNETLLATSRTYSRASLLHKQAKQQL